eukprot:TRINITY_DN53427_c0_g1_i1.p1 TRINITY_DN53427_c0_g1~~TRINITY_DN53427_c0_g1_i1.p1  ORF type:complete len:342 (-),score=1.98 TRINITY_DN53427_c0_g1_i1:90-1034(-)
MTDRAFGEFIYRLTRIQDVVQRSWENFRLHKTEQEAKAREMKDIFDNSLITLDVGGTTFKTSQQTLLSRPDTFFWALIHSGTNWEEKEEATNTYFIDRSPRMFDHILTYLRSGETPDWKSLSPHDRTQIERDRDFYGIQWFDGHRWLHPKEGSDEATSLALSADCHTVEILHPSGPAQKHFRVVRTKLVSDHYSWKISFLTCPDATLVFGVAPDLAQVGTFKRVSMRAHAAPGKGTVLTINENYNTANGPNQNGTEWTPVCAQGRVTISLHYKPQSNEYVISALGKTSTLQNWKPAPPQLLIPPVCGYGSIILE